MPIPGAGAIIQGAQLAASAANVASGVSNLLTNVEPAAVGSDGRTMPQSQPVDPRLSRMENLTYANQHFDTVSRAMSAIEAGKKLASGIVGGGDGGGGGAQPAPSAVSREGGWGVIGNAAKFTAEMALRHGEAGAKIAAMAMTPQEVGVRLPEMRQPVPAAPPSFGSIDSSLRTSVDRGMRGSGNGGGGGGAAALSMLGHMPYQQLHDAAIRDAEHADELTMREFALSLENSFRRDVVVRFVNHVAAVVGVNVRQIYALPPHLLEALHRDVQHGDYGVVPVLHGTRLPNGSGDDDDDGSEAVSEITKQLRRSYGLTTIHDPNSGGEWTSRPFSALEVKPQQRARVKFERSSAWDFMHRFCSPIVPFMTQARMTVLEGYCPHMRPMNENDLLANDEVWAAWADATAMLWMRARRAQGKYDLTREATREARNYELATLQRIITVLESVGWKRPIHKKARYGGDY